MKTLIPTLLFLALLSSACQKRIPLENALADLQFKEAASIKAPVLGINGFTVNGTVFAVNATNQAFGLQHQISFSSNHGATLICNTKFPFPAADGTFMFKLDNDLKKSTNIKVSCFLTDQGAIYDLVHPTDVVATLQVVNGRFLLTIPELRLDARDGSDNFINVTGTLSTSVSPVQVIEAPVSNSSSSTDGPQF